MGGWGVEQVEAITGRPAVRSSMDALVAAAAVTVDGAAAASVKPEHEALALVVLDHVLNITVLSHHAHVRASEAGRGKGRGCGSGSGGGSWLAERARKVGRGVLLRVVRGLEGGGM